MFPDGCKLFRLQITSEAESREKIKKQPYKKALPKAAPLFQWPELIRFFLLCAGQIPADKLRAFIKDLFYLLLTHTRLAKSQNLVCNVRTGTESNHHCLHG